MSAVDVFQVAIIAQPGDDHGRVLLTDVFVGEEAVDGIDNFRQGHAGDKLRVDHSLEDGSQQSGGNSLPADIGQHDGESFRRVYGLEKIAADFFAGHVASIDAREWNFGKSDGEETLLNGGCD